MSYYFFCIVSFYIFMILKAIHNKDYSVVKTFKAALTGRFFYAICCSCLNFLKKLRIDNNQLFIPFNSVTNL